jgi:hypothetical protein
VKTDEQSLIDVLANAIRHSLLFPNNPATPIMREALDLYEKSKKELEKTNQSAK